MGSLKRSNFPAVLKQYLPDYEPSFAVVPGPKASAGSPRAAGCRCQTGSEHKSRVTGNNSGRQRATRKSAKSPDPVARENTILRAERQELKRYRQNYENWQAAKADLREEDGRRLRVRILLQQDLIRQQAELSVRRQSQLLESIATRREAEKEERQAKTEALLEVCHKSLDEDKQKVSEDRRSQKPDSKHGGSKDSLLSGSSAPGGPTVKATLRRQVNQGPKRRASHHALTKEALATQPSMVAEEGEEAEEEKDGEREEQGADEGEGQEQLEAEGDEPLPWHWEQLYKLYGKQADYFLKPRPEEKERKKTVSNPNRLRVRGRAGAGSLWTSLRHDSEAKLLHQDMTISPDLKSAYSAFVRQCLARRKKPVKRNFYAEEDVPEMQRLLDNSRVLSAHDYRHMVEVMFRASTMNQDRTGVLLHNNPPPNLNNWSGDESCGRYMPSWIPDYEEEEEEPEYRKWIKQKDAGRPASASRSEQGQGDGRRLTAKMMSMSVDAGAAVRADAHHDDQWGFLREMKPKTRRAKVPKYLFLTEEAATCPGQFSRQRKELLDARHIPQAFAKPQSALAMVGENSTRRGSDLADTPRSEGRTQSQVSRQFTSNWQPLSLDALVEYKQAVSVMGQGDFQHGTVPRWSVDMVEKAH